ncbi:MAG TPA: PP2C family protein-serine/threonine phosphatase [Alloacidobacterium sp.]|nr:PP2C family protein-serine/threonine phosphatase [Alloacidobacterium sp.]
MASVSEFTARTGRTELVPRPVALPELEGVDLKARYNSARCGGDFFDGVVVGSRVLFLLSDIAGRRDETRPIAIEMQNVFRAKAQELFGPPDANESEGIALLARDVNRALIAAAHGVRFAPTFLGCFNLGLDILTYHNAGRLCAVFHDASSARVLDDGGIPMGLFTHSTYEPAVQAFEPGARLLLVTKGVTESGRGARVLGVERLRQLLETTSTNSASEICEAVMQEAHNFTNHPWSRIYDLFHPRKHRCHDDLTAVALMRSSSSL